MRNERIGMRRQIIFWGEKVVKIHTCIPQWMGISKAWMKSTIFLKCCHWNSYKGKPHNRCVLEKLAWTCCIQVTLKQTSEITILFSNTRCHSAWKSPKMSHLNFSILAFLMNFFSTQNLNVAHFARNVEWDVFCDFQTPCSQFCILLCQVFILVWNIGLPLIHT